jgi:two-component system CheB/CheR fusion protein
VVLSGAASDGSLGLRAIKGESGMVIAQDPKTAKTSGMPTSAIATGLVDFVAKPGAIAEILVKYTGGPYLSPKPSELQVPILEEPLMQILQQLRTRSGNDLSEYKTNTIKRRIERRMNLHGIRDAEDFVRFTSEHPEELDALFKELLISVTNFFRDPDAFGALGGEPLRTLLAAHNVDLPLRVWVPGCATGEEAYSLAILLHERMDAMGKHPKVMIFGTDLDEKAIRFARAGLYPPGIVGDIEPTRLERYFNKEEGAYRVSKKIRDMIIFAPQNVIGDPLFTKLDLLSCRNLLIYMTSDLQKRLLPMFAYALNPGGLMLLGPHESLAGVSDRFAIIDNKWKIFRRKNNGNKLSEIHIPPTISKIKFPAMPENPPSPKKVDQDPVAASMSRLLLAKFAPPCVVVNRRGDIEYIHGRTGSYLEPATGRPA